MSSKYVDVIKPQIAKLYMYMYYGVVTLNAGAPVRPNSDKLPVITGNSPPFLPLILMVVFSL